MYVTKHIIDNINVIVLKVDLEFSKRGGNQTLWFVKINNVMLKKMLLLGKQKKEITC